MSQDLILTVIPDKLSKCFLGLIKSPEKGKAHKAFSIDIGQMYATYKNFGARELQIALERQLKGHFETNEVLYVTTKDSQYLVSTKQINSLHFKECKDLDEVIRTLVLVSNPE